MDYSKLSDFEINRCVARAIDGLHGNDRAAVDCYLSVSNSNAVSMPDGDIGWIRRDYCNNAADAWPIIEKHGITLAFDGSDWWATSDACWVDGCEWQIQGEINRKPFRAAMICYLKMQESE